ncbi:MAG: hypothetical protein ABF741_11305, partial [Liquorilactobacillus ghanensis]
MSLFYLTNLLHLNCKSVVTNMGKTLKGDLKRTVEVLKLAKAKILGSVERVRASKGDRGYGYGYGYGYQSNDVR